MNAQDLKNSILQLAVQGKLVEQRPEEGTAKELLAQIKSEKEQLIKDKKIKKEKPLPEITEEEIPFEIPESWEWVRVSDLCDMYTGNSISESVKKSRYMNISEGYDYIGTKDIQFSGKIDYNNGVRIPYSDSFRVAPSNSILMCIEGGSAGRKIGILDRTVCFGNKLCMFNPINMNNRYVFFALQAPMFISSFREGMTGIIGGVSLNKLKTLLIPVPPIDEQKRIVAKIEEILPYIEQYDKAYTKLEAFNKKFPEDMKKSILQMAMQGKLVEQRPEEGTADELYEQIVAEKARLIKEGKIKKEKPLAEISEDEIPFEVPESWKWVRLGDIFASIADGDHQPPPQVPDGIPFLVISNISGEKIELDNVRHVPKEYFDALNNGRRACKGDILFTVTGSYGIVVPVDFDIQFCFQRHMALLKPLVVATEFYVEWLRSPLVYNQCTNLATGIAQKTVGINSLKSIMIPLPPLEEQKRIVAKLEQMMPYCDRLIK